MVLRTLTCVVVFCCFAVPALAQDDRPATPQEAACELHVWPSAGLKETRATLWDNFKPGGGAASTGNGGYFIIPTPSIEQRVARDSAPVQTIGVASEDPFPPSSQLDALKSLPLAEMSGIDGYTTIFHETPLSAQFLRATTGRYVQTSNCYADLVVSDVVYSQEAANGQNLKVFFRFRDFASQPLPVRHLSTWVQTKLASPRYGKKADIAAGNAETPRAFVENARKFAAFLKAR